MFQSISDDGATLCDCQKAFGSYSTISNEMDNDGIHTSLHFKFEWKFEQQSTVQIASYSTFYIGNYLLQNQPFFPSLFSKDVFRPPSFYCLHKTA